MGINKIVRGTYNNLLKKEERLFKDRMNICKNCRLYRVDSIVGPVCSSGLYLNPLSDEVSKEPLPGYIKGCGCLLNSKTRVRDAKCPTKKW